MRPTQVTATGIKTGGINLPLDPVTIVTGDNGKGKTAVADALKIALLGYHPNLGKRPAEILKLSSEDVLEVAVDLDGIAEAIVKTFTRTKTGGSLKDSGGIKDLPSFPAVILDFDAFIQAKPTARREILESVLPPIDARALADEIEGFLADFPNLEVEGQDFVKLAERVGEAGREWKQERDRLKGAIQSIEIKLSETVEPGSEPIDVVQLRADRDVVLKDQATVASKIADVADRLKKARPKPSDPKPTPEALAEAKKSVEDEKKVVEENRKIELANAETRRIIGEVERRAEPEGVSKLKTELGELQQTLFADRRDLANAKSRVAELEEQIVKVQSLGECPTCRAKADVALEAITAAVQPKIDEFSGRVDEIEDRISKAEKRHGLIESEIETALAADQAKREEKIAELRKTFVDVEPDRLDEFERELSDLKDLAAAWDHFESFEAPTDEERTRIQKDAEDLAAQLATIDGKLAEADQNEKARLLVRTLRANLSEAKEELEAAEKRVKEAKTVGDWAKTRSLEVTAERLTPLLDPANSVLAGVIEGSLAIDGTDVGLKRGDDFRPIEVLSGAEATAVAAGLQVALASNCPLRFVILDELSRLTYERKDSLVRNLVAAVDSNLIDGILILDHDEAFVGSFEGTSIGVHRVA